MRDLSRPRVPAIVSESGSARQRLRPCATTSLASVTRTWAVTFSVNANTICETFGLASWRLSAAVAVFVRARPETSGVGSGGSGDMEGAVEPSLGAGIGAGATGWLPAGLGPVLEPPLVGFAAAALRACLGVLDEIFFGFERSDPVGTAHPGGA